ncbi:MAG: flagellar hook protein FlgE [Pseudomonas sp.]|uniref:flagellar hook protein FlgE n=1 Tax=Stenotrophomonas sp. TaxID=69392 RepID=UPI003D6D8FFB
MLESIYIGMSGLTAHAKGLQTISNNVANINTPGFKTTTPRFSDLYYGQQFSNNALGYASTMQLGSGVEYGYSFMSFSQGDIRASDGQLDLAIQGEGFIPLLDGDQVKYVRTGQFIVGDDGYIQDKATGLRLATLSGSGALQPISLEGKRMSPPSPTTSIKFSDNLSSGATEFSIPNVDVYDSSGEKHTLKIVFTPDSGIFPGRWAVSMVDANGREIGRNTLQFLGGIPEPGMDLLEFTLEANNAEASTITLDFSAGVTSFSAGTYSSLRVSTSDGYAAGSLSSVFIDEDGSLTQNYSNGQKETSGKVALALFSDPQRLIQESNGLFNATKSPPPSFTTSKENGAGMLVSGYSEASNVDLSTEFGRLIMIQRGFQASSQVISTANEMIMQLFQMRGQG